MLSAIVLVPLQPATGGRSLPDTLVRTLAALVPAAIEGVLRDLTITAPLGYEGLGAIADHAGCELVEAGSPQAALLEALKATREDNVFLLKTGRAPDHGFADELAETIGEGRRFARMRERPDSFATRLLPGLSPVAALLAPRERLAAAAADDLGRIAARLGAAPTLRTRARRVD